MTGAELRERFLTFFEERGHARVASSPVVPAGDPTLLFTNAGMVQFKDVFLGLEKRPYLRAVTSQKCVRASGKHNDLEDVGRTARHATFFEMLGNFSFGDYFKREAVGYAWEFLTEDLGLEKARLWITIFRDDDEAHALWQEVAGVGADRIVRLGEKDNFWAMGDTGPCGPCSEIVYDRGPEHSCGRPDCALDTCGCDRWRELWNLVFMQFNRDADGRLEPLPRPSIDTGMGLERAVSTLQGTDSLYETDLLRPIISATEELAGATYRPFPDPAGVPFRVIADHARCCAFVVADGVLPSNVGRGYVLRRILRRAARYGRPLGLNEPFLHRLVPVVAGVMGDVYPEVRQRQAHVADVVRAEEERFAQTLEAGLRRAEEIIARVRAEGGTAIPGPDAFMLYDTYGLPVESAEDIAQEHGLTVDRAGFQAAMEEQRRRAREAWVAGLAAGGRAAAAQLADAFDNVPATEFLGYDPAYWSAEARVLALIGGDGGTAWSRRPALEAGAEGYCVLDRTPFYAEAGGQVADTGAIAGPAARARVLDTQRLPNGVTLHRVRVEAGRLGEGDAVTAAIDAERRRDVQRNHTATHLLHKALKEVLGEHASQAGSLVAPDRLRFDFTHPEGLTPDQLRAVEERVNRQVLGDAPVRAYHRTLEEARAEGAMALFGEKYTDVVRVVEVEGYSKELCGGTHVRRTGEIGLFHLLGEAGVAAGIRRVEAVTGAGVLDAVHRARGLLAEAAEALHAGPDQLPERAAALAARVKELERELEAARARQAKDSVSRLVEGALELGGARVVAGTAPAADADGLRAVADLVRDRIGSGVVLLGAGVPAEGGSGGRAHFVCMVTRDLVDRGLHAGNIVRRAAAVAGGGGGGRPDMAQAGGKDPAALERALAEGVSAVREALGGGAGGDLGRGGAAARG